MKFRTGLFPLAVSSLLVASAMAGESQKNENVEVATLQDAIDAYFHTIPFLKDDSSGLRYVPAEIEGTKIMMLVDSGAHRTVFDVDAAGKAGIKLKRSGHSATGTRGTTEVQQGTVASFKIGGIVKVPEGIRYFIDLGEGKNIRIGGKKSKCGGLWGYDFMAAADFNIDFSGNRVLLAKQSVTGGYWSLLKQSGYRKIDLAVSNSTAYIPVKLGDKQGFFQIDTGSSQMILFDPFAKDKNYDPLERDGSIEGVGNKARKGRFVTVDDFAIPGYRIKSPMLVVPVEKTKTIQGRPVMGVLGVPCIDKFKMIFNFHRHHLYMPAK